MPDARVSGEVLKETRTICHQADNFHMRARVPLMVCGRLLLRRSQGGFPSPVLRLTY